MDEDPNHKILVHCFAGKSRATTFTLAYMIAMRGMNLKDALELVWTVRPIAAPNPGFMTQLKAYEKEKLGNNSQISVMQGKFA